MSFVGDHSCRASEECRKPHQIQTSPDKYYYWVQTCLQVRFFMINGDLMFDQLVNMSLVTK